MRLVAFVLMAALSFGMSPAVAARIGNDAGGRIGTYVDRFTRLRDSGEPVAVDGQCLSACTLVLGLVPRDRICVTSNASFGFHAAWSPDSSGDPVASPAATRLLWDMYPPRIRTWIRAHGGLRRNMIFLRGAQLAALYPVCTPGFERGGFAQAAHRPNVRTMWRREAGRSLARRRPLLRRGPAAAVAAYRSARVAPRDRP